MITKAAEPQRLVQYRAQNTPPSETAFRDYPGKDQLRELLIGEQKGLCCYCMSRVHNDPLRMKIEHWRCQERYQDLRLSYGNLLGACLGGEGRPKKEQHCDTRKGNRDLKWNPATAAHMIETRVRYRVDGVIESPDEEFDAQLNNVLGLNIAYLRNSRKAALDAVLVWWHAAPKAREKIQQQIDRRTGAHVQLEPFIPVAIWFLRQKLTAAS